MRYFCTQPWKNSNIFTIFIYFSRHFFQNSFQIVEIVYWIQDNSVFLPQLSSLIVECNNYYTKSYKKSRENHQFITIFSIFPQNRLKIIKILPWFHSIRFLYFFKLYTLLWISLFNPKVYEKLGTPLWISDLRGIWELRAGPVKMCEITHIIQL